MGPLGTDLPGVSPPPPPRTRLLEALRAPSASRTARVGGRWACRRAILPIVRQSLAPVRTGSRGRASPSRGALGPWDADDHALDRLALGVLLGHDLVA
jgi:hypothetical protein